MSNEIKYVNKRMIVTINKLSILLTHGISLDHNNIRDGQAFGFVDRIYSNNVFGEKIFPDIFHQAAAYLFYIIKNHLFHDGNKRTGLAVAILFLEWNDILFTPFNEEEVFNFIMEIAAGENVADKAIPKIAQWFKSMSIN
ncbi:MAG: type II toxin-antitoxin system death-on-curing family toxin [Planctomycetota bacterium]